MSFLTYIKKRITILPWLVVGGIVMTLLACKSCLTSANYFFSIATLTIFSWVMMWFGNEYLHEYLDEKINWTKFPIKRLVTGLMVLMLYTIIATYIIAFVANNVFEL